MTLDVILSSVIIGILTGLITGLITSWYVSWRFKKNSENNEIKNIIIDFYFYFDRIETLLQYNRLDEINNYNIEINKLLNKLSQFGKENKKVKDIFDSVLKMASRFQDYKIINGSLTNQDNKELLSELSNFISYLLYANMTYDKKYDNANTNKLRFYKE